MLPTNERAVNKGDLVLNSVHSLFIASANMRPNTMISDYYKSQHLYITSDEAIGENDWFIDTKTNKLHKCKQVNGDKIITDELDLHEPLGDCYYYFKKTESKKIISTTDKSLGLPTVSDGFVKKFIERYNTGNLINDVMVEYEEWPELERITGTNTSFRTVVKKMLKVDKNNCITITSVKDTWTREEVISLCRDCFENSCKYSTFNEWIEQNL